MTARDPLAPLRVLDRLEVGPARVEPRRLTAPYRVTAADGSTDEMELVYRWEEPVFEPEDPTSRNLAALVAAQVALNYGLFCRELVLGGPLDAADRRFLRDAAENTAREIYVKKLLEPNPFLVGEASELPAVKRKSHLRAELVFPDAGGTGEGGAGEEGADDAAAGDQGTGRNGPGAWRAEPGRIAVLASGGKDSLLSHGLLREAGLDVHAVFGNESGRHWYTALNAYRHFEEAAPERTARVWMNSDRVFAWMLRHLPFVREDFGRVRSDEYPIRLWTVAVFLFGALPVLRTRGIGRVVVGDEFDTSRRVRHEGIPHYDGLYDQSRWFDDALTRFYRRKGWPLSQFSILRPLSELLIQKTLAERYPDLLAHQVSCHAASVDGHRVRPCGKCEKCRRIVAMLLAVEREPASCGYTEEQVRECLARLAEKGVHQEAPAARHLAWMLARKGLLPDDAPGFPRVGEAPEVMKLRFHEEASPPRAIPGDLRRPVWSRLLEHAEGAVVRRGRVWAPFDPLDPDVLARPYPYERGGAGGGGRSPGGSPDRGRGPPADGGTAASEHVLGEMTWPRAGARLAETDTGLLPVGAIEQHGPHLPLDTDAFDAELTCLRVAERCSAPKPLVLPLIPYGVSYHHQDFPGTLSIGPRTLARLVYEVGMSAARQGIAKLVIVNGHGGNAPALQFAAQMINRDARIFTCVDTGETSDADVAAIAETDEDLHAGEIETSTALASRPDLVDMGAAETFVPRFRSRYLSASSGRGVPWFVHTGRISPSGVLGDPSKATREKGEEIWEVSIDHMARFVEAIKSMSLAEIHEKEL